MKGLKNKLDCFAVMFLITTVVLLSSFAEDVVKADAQSSRIMQKTYENDIYGFKLDYPPNWEFEERGSVFETSEVIGNFDPRAESKLDGPYIAILVKFLSSNNATLQEYTQYALNEIKTPSALLSDKIEIISENQSANLGGQPAYSVIYSDITETDQRKIMTIWTVLETEAYRLTFVAQHPGEYDRYINTARRIMNSFEFTRY